MAALPPFRGMGGVALTFTPLLTSRETGQSKGGEVRNWNAEGRWEDGFRAWSASDHTSSEVILPAAVWSERERTDAWRTKELAARCPSLPGFRKTDALGSDGMGGR